MFTLTYALDTNPDAIPIVIPVKQFDTDVQLGLSFFSSKGGFVVENYTVKVRGKKPDGNGIELSASAISAVAQVSSLVVTEQMTIVYGRSEYEVLLTATGGKKKATASFILDVHPSALPYGTPMEDSEPNSPDDTSSGGGSNKIEDTGWVSLTDMLNSGVTTVTHTGGVRKWGSFVEITQTLSFATSATSFDLLTLPADFRPSKRIYKPCYFTNKGMFIVYVTTAGIVRLLNPSSTVITASDYMYLNLGYLD